jgi:hypothetical protein
MAANRAGLSLTMTETAANLIGSLLEEQNTTEGQ